MITANNIIKYNFCFLLLLIFPTLLISQQPNYNEIKKFGNEIIPLEDRISDLTFLYQEVNYNFAFFDQISDLDWKQTFEKYKKEVAKTEKRIEFIRLLQRFMAELEEGHANVVPTYYLTDYFGGTPALEFLIVEGQPVVVNTAKELAQRIPIGSIAIAVEGISVHEYLKNNVFPYLSASSECSRLEKAVRLYGEPGISLLSGERGTTINVTFPTPQGEHITEELTRFSRRDTIDWQMPTMLELKPLEFEWISSGIALITINDFSKKEVITSFDMLLPDIEKATGIIIDVRKNWGGNSAIGAYIISHFIDKPLTTGTWTSRQHVPTYRAYGKSKTSKYRTFFSGEAWIDNHKTIIQPAKKKQMTNMPVMVLSSCRSYSATEDFLNFAKAAAPNVKIIGQTSAGSTGQPWIFKLNSGTFASITTRREITYEGALIVGNGISPDIQVEQTLKAQIANRDLVLENALAKIKN